MKQAQDCRRNEASTELSLTINKAVTLSLSKGKSQCYSIHHNRDFPAPLYFARNDSRKVCKPFNNKGHSEGSVTRPHTKKGPGIGAFVYCSFNNLLYHNLFNQGLLTGLYPYRIDTAGPVPGIDHQLVVITL